MPRNAEVFLDAFASIEGGLRRTVREERFSTFYSLVERAAQSSRVVQRYREDLKEYADLRNAIVHERSDGHVIAEPIAAVVGDLQRIRDLLIDPPKVYPKFHTKVESVLESGSLADAVSVMLTNAFSQLPVVQNKEVVALLTANNISRWLGHEAKSDVFSLQETSIRDVLRHAEDDEVHCFVSRDATIFDALALFSEFTQRGKRLEAILITQRGRADETLLGILTVSDLPAAHQMVSIERTRRRSA